MDKDTGFCPTDSRCAAFSISSYFVIWLLILQKTLRAFCHYFSNELLDLNTRDIFCEILLIVFTSAYAVLT